MSWYDEIEGEFIMSPKQIDRVDVKHPKAIFTQWSTAELIAIGIYPFISIVKDSDYDYGDLKFTKMGTVYQETTSSTKKPIEERAAVRLRFFNYQCDEEINALTAGYPRAERDSWYKQAAEANAYALDSKAATPLLDAMTGGDATVKAALVGRILIKIDMFAAAVGAVLKKKNDLEVRLDSGEEPSTVNW